MCDYDQGQHCILDRFAIRSVRNIVDSFNRGASTASLCAIDVSKAFDRENHHALFSKLMKRHVSNAQLTVLERWLSSCGSCVKWYDVWSDFLPSAMELNRVQFSRHFSLLCTWMIFPKCSPVKRCLYCAICRSRPFCL